VVQDVHKGVTGRLLREVFELGTGDRLELVPPPGELAQGDPSQYAVKASDRLIAARVAYSKLFDPVS
jgi:hypothetical protein